MGEKDGRNEYTHEDGQDGRTGGRGTKDRRNEHMRGEEDERVGKNERGRGCQVSVDGGSRTPRVIIIVSLD